MTLLTRLIKYRNEIAILGIVVVLAAFGFYIRYIYKDRLALKDELKQLHTEVEVVKKQITLNEDIANAIKKIKIQSNNYVSVVEGTPTPEAGSSFVAIPSGVFKPTSVLPPTTFRNTSSSNGGTKNSTSN